MGYKFLNSLNLDQLEELKVSLSSSDNGLKDLLDEIESVISIRTRIENGVIDFSSDRLSNYRKENEGRCIELLSELTLNDVPFLRGAFSAREVNRMGPLLTARIDDNLSDNFNLLTLNEFFSEPYTVFCYEGVYNSLNYVKNQIYYYLLNNSNVSKSELFDGMEYKMELTSKQLADIASYLYEIKKLSSQLKVSTGNAGISGTRKRSDKKDTLSSYQKRFVQAVAFGTTCEKLENGNYEDCKRLLFIPRSRERKYR